uniref:Tyrosine-protein phosphatase domain-containing protein n=1 Tax=Strongyloides papillosus TaxID=174720 RepID=A0A0N5B9V9_STREA
MKCFWLLDLYLLISFFTTAQASDSSGFETFYRKTISSIKFPIIIKVPISSDLIFVKCPGNNYVHDNENDTFNSDTSRQFTPIYISTDNDKVRLHVINLRNIEKDGNEITCGMLHLFSKNKTIRWSYKLEFTSIAEVINKSTPFYDIDKIDTKCENYSYKTVNYYKISNEMILEGLPKTDEIIKDTIIYSLPLIGLEENKEIVVPCKILRATNKKPTIELKNYKNISIVEKSKSLYYVKKVFGRSIQYTPLLIVPSDMDVSKFYSEEKISICQVKYVGENTYKNGNKKSLKDNTFSIYSYGIYEISYFCDICVEGKNIETKKMFFFGPEEDTEIYEETYNIYPKQLLTKYPSCSFNTFSFAYLLKMSFNDESIYIKNLTKSKTTSGFVVKSDSISYNKERNPNGILTCTYQGPGRRFIIKNIYNPIDIKIYGINKGPSEDKINDFWKTIYEKDVVVVLGISYHGKRKEDYNVMNYCPQKRGTNKFGTISVEFLQYYNPRSPQTVGYVYQMTNEEGKLKYVTILHFSGWQIHKFPEYIHHTLNPLYEEIKGLTNKRYDCVLLHTSYGPDSRIFTFTFFSLMVEIMEGMDGTDEPMDIIDEVRNIINECYISSLEYILIQSSLVEYFYNKRILYGIASRIRFVEKYKMYLYNVFSSEKDMNFEIKEFLWFCRIMDLGKLRNICRQFTRIGSFGPQKLAMKCKRFYKIIDMPDKCDKIRDKSMPCLDAFSVDCYNGLSDITNYDTFINANSLTYRISYDEKQTIILCQVSLEKIF